LKLKLLQNAASAAWFVVGKNRQALLRELGNHCRVSGTRRVHLPRRSKRKAASAFTGRMIIAWQII
jgi:hypothetical protein